MAAGPRRRLGLGVLLITMAVVQSPSAPQAQMQGPGGPGRMMGGGMMARMWGSMPRHRTAMHAGIPLPYASMRNPIRWSETVRREAIELYRDNCASCHGPEGRGDGEAGRELSPPPADLRLLARTPFGSWDAFLFWAISEGGEPFGTDMPAFKDVLPAEDIWKLVSWIKRGMPGS